MNNYETRNMTSSLDSKLFVNNYETRNMTSSLDSKPVTSPSQIGLRLLLKTTFKTCFLSLALIASDLKQRLFKHHVLNLVFFEPCLVLATF